MSAWRRIPSDGVRRVDPLSALSIGAGVLAWEILSRARVLSETLVPPPSAVAGALVMLLSAPWFATNLWATLSETLIGYAFASAIALLLGIALGLQRTIRTLLERYVVAFQVLPKVMLAPIFVTWFGFGLESKVVMAATLSFFPVFVNTILGLTRNVDEPVLLLRSLEASPQQIFWKVRWPVALPSIFAGLETSITIALLGSLTAELVNAQLGLGVLLNTFAHQYQLAAAFAVLVILAALGSGLFYSVRAIGRRVVFWQ